MKQRIGDPSETIRGLQVDDISLDQCQNPNPCHRRADLDDLEQNRRGQLDGMPTGA